MSKKNRKSQKNPSIVGRVESLEERRLLAAGAFIEGGGKLVVRGTAGNDQIYLANDPANSSELRVTVGSQSWDFAKTRVQQIRVEAGRGNDRIEASSGIGKAPLFVLGDAGNDTLVGGDNNDCLLGGGEADVIVAARGHNYLDAGDGNDKVFAGSGNDTLIGAAGNDYLSDAGGSNNIVGGAGTNTVVTAPVPATIPSATAPNPTGGVQRGNDTPTPAPAPAPAPSDNAASPFVIGVWSQPAWSMQKWKDRGINTAIGYESLSGTVSVDSFSQQVSKLGMYMIRHPNWANLASDKQYTNLLAWMHNDEPDYKNVPASKLQADYAKLKAANHNLPVFVNFAGSFALWGYGGKKQADYQAWMKGADWISNDLYPITAHNRPSALDAAGLAVERLANWSGGKRQFSVIEASDQELSDHPDYPGVTPDQFRAQVFNAVIKGATGIIYFPQKIGGGFKFDNMTTPVEAEMKSVNARLTRIGAALMSRKDPAGVNVDVDGALRATWRIHNGKTYIIVLNHSTQAVAARFTVSGVKDANATVDAENRSVAIKSGQITDTFKPFQAHVYVV